MDLNEAIEIVDFVRTVLTGSTSFRYVYGGNGLGHGGPVHLATAGLIEAMDLVNQAKPN